MENYIFYDIDICHKCHMVFIAMKFFNLWYLWRTNLTANKKLCKGICCFYTGKKKHYVNIFDDEEECEKYDFFDNENYLKLTSFYKI